jgi:hypothetical protein
MANMAGIEIDKEKHNEILNKSVKLSAWLQVGLPILLFLVLLIWFLRRRAH